MDRGLITSACPPPADTHNAHTHTHTHTNLNYFRCIHSSRLLNNSVFRHNMHPVQGVKICTAFAKLCLLQFRFGNACVLTTKWGLFGTQTPTWSISMSLGKALGHSMATLTMSAGGGMAEGGGWSVWVSLPHTSVTTTGSSSSKPGGQEWKRREDWRGRDGGKKIENGAC